MHKPIRHFVAIALLGAALLAQPLVHAHEHPVDDLLALPHPMRVLNRPHWVERLSPEQKAAIATLRSEIQPRYLALMGEAAALQEQLRTAVFAHDPASGPSAAALQAYADVRLRMSEVQVGAYARLKAILDQASWTALLDELRD